MSDLATLAMLVNATSGNGQVLVLREPKFVTFRVTGNGSVTAGVITIECCPQITPIALGSGPSSGSGGAMVWTALTTLAAPANAITDYVPGWV